MPKQIKSPTTGRTVPMFTLEISSTGDSTEYFALYCGNTIVADQHKEKGDDDWMQRVEGAKQLVTHAGGIIKKF